ncbi:hypothetical protein [Marinivivus vitaminiproducens]|uniref:hypothetical protein n=1 Tax=Marinivivus vitaminiproducens TaxID=3035935 RepID=UPI0027A4AA26|nr:hypothetical protein P4R82_13980 [Geminicoccaceae bacterium SCSIO 64248]
MSAPVAIAIHDLKQGRAALDAARRLSVPVALRTAPGAAAYLGAGYLAALEDALGVPLLVDCGGDAGLVMAALRAGSRRLAFNGRHDVAIKLQSMCGQMNARFEWETRPPSCLVLAPGDDPLRRLVLHLRE